MKHTEIYLVRHAHKSNNILYSFPLDMQYADEKRPLSVRGQMEAKQLSLLHCFDDTDMIYSSDYVRAMSTALYLAEKLDCKIHIYPGFGERIKRKDRSIYMPDDFRMQQMRDENYKIYGGESRKEVFARFYKGILMILEKNPNKKIVIFSHKTAITMLLMNWCSYVVENDVHLSYNGTPIFDGKWDGSPEIFRLIFDGIELISISKIDNHCDSLSHNYNINR